MTRTRPSSPSATATVPSISTLTPGWDTPTTHFPFSSASMAPGLSDMSAVHHGMMGRRTSCSVRASESWMSGMGGSELGKSPLKQPFSSDPSHTKSRRCTASSPASCTMTSESAEKYTGPCTTSWMMT